MSDIADIEIDVDAHLCLSDLFNSCSANIFTLSIIVIHPTLKLFPAYLPVMFNVSSIPPKRHLVHIRTFPPK